MGHHCVPFIIELLFQLRKQNRLYNNCNEDKNQGHVSRKQLQIERFFFKACIRKVHGISVLQIVHL